MIAFIYFFFDPYSVFTPSPPSFGFSSGLLSQAGPAHSCFAEKLWFWCSSSEAARVQSTRKHWLNSSALY
ncbi:hypothetical protein GN956_G14947 [Arapaima gigas]